MGLLQLLSVFIELYHLFKLFCKTPEVRACKSLFVSHGSVFVRQSLIALQSDSLLAVQWSRAGGGAAGPRLAFRPATPRWAVLLKAPFNKCHQPKSHTWPGVALLK